jgi:hypothetical protein
MSFLGAQNSIALGVQGLIHIDTGGGAGGSADYLLAKSLRFRSSASAYLNRTPATATNQKTWTWSAWVKRGTLGTTQNLATVANTGSSLYFYLRFLSTDVLEVFTYNAAGSAFVWQLQTTQLFRDPAAWYHIVVATDTTQGTASNRVKIYVNGSQITAFAIATYPSASYDTVYNFNGASYVTSYLGAANFYDGELAELNSVDGYPTGVTSGTWAATNVSTIFGAYSIYNQWLPIAYAGTYGTNGFYLPFSGGTATSYAGSFNGSTQYLTVPNDAAFTLGATSTTEAWIYLTSATGNKRIVTNGSNTNSFDVGIFGTTNTVFVAGANANTTTAISLNTWTHVAVVFNAGTLTIYFNGVSQSLTGTTTGYSLVASTLSAVFIGAQNASSYFPGYISNLRVVKGTAVYTANFVPPTTALTAITNTSLLTLQNATIVDNSTNAFTITNVGTVVTSVQSPFLNPTVLTADSSGNANNWTPNNISLTAGSTYDSLTDVPTLTSTTVANYAVLNPLQIGSYVTLSNGNLTVTGNTATDSALVLATVGKLTSGKWYWEYTQGTIGSETCGVITQNIDGLSLLNGESTTSLYGVGARASGTVYGGTVGSITSWTTGDVIGLSLDCDNGAIYWSKNGTALNGGVPTSGASKTGAVGAWTPSPTKIITPSFGAYNSGFVSATFGQRPFTYTAPTGFLPLNTFNIAAGTVTTSGTFTGNLSTDGPFVFLNGTPTAMTINGNAVTFGTHADKLANGFKVRSSSASYNASGSNTYVATTVEEVFKYEEAQANP